jgi:ABC-type glycerol-3-phosphate transport system substrate-binding protein
MNKKLAALAAVAVVAICGSMIYLSQSPEATSQEVASTTSTTTNNGPVRIIGARISFSLEQ